MARYEDDEDAQQEARELQREYSLEKKCRRERFLHPDPTDPDYPMECEDD